METHSEETALSNCFASRLKKGVYSVANLITAIEDSQ